MDLEETCLDVQGLTIPKEGLDRQRSYSDEPVEKGELNVVVKRLKHVPVPQLDEEIPSYKMTEVPRGLALIIEIEQYQQDVATKRIGSHVSLPCLANIFK